MLFMVSNLEIFLSFTWPVCWSKISWTILFCIFVITFFLSEFLRFLNHPHNSILKFSFKMLNWSFKINRCSLQINWGLFSVDVWSDILWLEVRTKYSNTYTDPSPLKMIEYTLLFFSGRAMTLPGHQENPGTFAQTS